jgi:hypothetical protein
MASLKYLLKGMSLYQEDDHQWLTTDPTISDSRLLGVLPLSDGHRSRFSSRCNHCWSSSPRASDTFAGCSDAATPTADGTTGCYRNAADNGGAHFHCSSNEKAAFGVERPSDTSRPTAASVPL